MASQIQSFQDFVKSLSSATHSQFATAPGGPDAKAFDDMRRFLIDRYRGVESKHTFEMADGLIVDCVPVEQQPALRGAKPATPPSMPPTVPYSGSSPDFAKEEKADPPPQLDPNYKDRFGNQHSCPAGSIPMVRLTLEQLTRFETLEDFFQKAPGGGRGPLSRRAESIDYGGETVGTGTWPPMGAGVFPGGFGWAAYQKSGLFYPPSGGAANAQLTERQPSPGCYRIALVNNSGPEWGTYFFFGGPGGTGC